MNANTLNTIIGIVAGLVSILTGVIAIIQTTKAKKANGETQKELQKTPPAKREASLKTAMKSTGAKPMSAAVAGVIEFTDNDNAYQKWIHDNPAGFVINSPRKPNPEYMALHRASCSYVSNFSKREAGAFTEREYIKVCANDKASLSNWTKAHGRTDGSFTGNCNCKPL